MKSNLASPLFFVALGQWVLLRRFVAQAGWWLLTGALGFLFVYPYLLIYSFSALSTSGQSLIFGTQEFWSVSLSLALMSLIFGSLVGLMQGVLVIRRVGAVPRQLFSAAPSPGGSGIRSANSFWQVSSGIGQHRSHRPQQCWS